MSCFAWIPDDGELETDATEYDTTDPAWAAELCAEHSWNNNGADWQDEYMVSVRCPDGVVRSYRVCAEMEPAFTASLIGAGAD